MHLIPIDMDDLKEKAFEIFRKMSFGQIIIIADVAKKDPKAFIQYGKDFIDAGNYDYEFTDKYVSFRRMWDKISEERFEQELTEIQAAA